MIDVVIGLVLLFFALASVCSFIQERIASLFSLRQKQLVRALEGMLQPAPDPLLESRGVLWRLSHDIAGTIVGFFKKRPSGAVDELLRQPAIKALRGKGWAGPLLREAPSYLPKDFFVDAARRLSQDPGAAIKLSEDAYKILNSLDDEGIGRWFDATMERAQGGYKRQSQFIILCIATVVVVGFNIDAVALGGALLKNSAMREVIAIEARTVAASKGGTAIGTKAMRDLLDETALGIGTSCKMPPDDGSAWDSVKVLSACMAGGGLAHVKQAPQHAFGWLVSILAAALGAPFWFDLLSKVTQVRASGANPSEERPQGTLKARARKREDAADDDTGPDTSAASREADGPRG